MCENTGREKRKVTRTRMGSTAALLKSGQTGGKETRQGQMSH